MTACARFRGFVLPHASWKQSWVNRSHQTVSLHSAPLRSGVDCKTAQAADYYSCGFRTGLSVNLLFSVNTSVRSKINFLVGPQEPLLATDGK